jgi:hypothetical protein
MANSNTPRGFKPAVDNDFRPFNGGTRWYQLPSNFATAIYAGDVVKFLTTGYLAKAVAGDQMRGVVAGFRWTAATGIPVVGVYLPANTVTLNGADIQVQVYDDPNMVFEAVFTNSTSVPAFADKGATFNLIDTGGSAASGLSGEGIDYTTLNTTAQQFRFMDFVQRPDNDVTSANSRGLFAPALHDFRVNTGI